MIARNDGMPGGMCHSHASHSEATIPIENDGKWHVVMPKPYYYIHMIQAAIRGRFSSRFKYRRIGNKVELSKNHLRRKSTSLQETGNGGFC